MRGTERLQSVSARVATWTLAVATAWSVVAQAVTPWVVRAVHGGRGPQLLQDFVAREIENPEGFLSRWAGYGWSVTYLVLGLGTILAMATNQRFQHWVEARHGRAGDIDLPHVLGPRRARIVLVAIGIGLGGSLLSMLTAVEVWPFSPYRMYATIQGDSLTLPRLYGATGSGEVDLRRVEDTPPFDVSRFQWALRRLMASGRDCRSMSGVARYALAATRGGRTDPEHGARAIRSVRLYLLSWRLDREGFRLVPGERRLVCDWPVTDPGQ